MNGTTDRHAPIGFYNRADDFYKAANLCAAADGSRTVRFLFGHVPYHFHTHSVELALKAYPRAQNVTEAELKTSCRHHRSDPSLCRRRAPRVGVD